MNLIARDKKHLWHPLTQHKTYPDPIGIAKAKGVYLYDIDGKAYIDGISSWYSCVYGHSHPYIVNKLKQQLDTLHHVVFTGFTHQPAVDFSERLMQILPKNQQKVFFSDNGSTATEVGIKLALQCHYNKGEKRNMIIAFEAGFHGDTFGAMSASDLPVYNGAFRDFFIDVKRIPVPNGENNKAVILKMQQISEENHIAGFIYEPIVQGAAAMKIHNIEGLEMLLKFCKSEGIITISDEVMTGFGKTGKFFASDYIETKPDIICLSKALTAGMLPMGATTCSQEIFDVFYDNEISKGFFHGHTYSANPLACTAATAGIELLVSDKIQSNLKMISKTYELFENRIKNHPNVKNIRHIGAIFAFDLKQSMSRYGNLRNQLFNYFMECGVCLRPLGNTIYCMPPYIITQEELNKILAIMENLLNK